MGLRPERFPIKWTRLQDWPIGQHIGRHVDFVLGAIDQCNVDMFEIFRRRRLIVDVKNRKSPKVSERIIWTKGLQAALGVDGAIVVTTDKRPGARRLSKTLNVTLIDGDAVTKLTQSEQLKKTGQLRSDEFDDAVKRVDEGRRSVEWRQNLQDARASLISGLGVQSTNRNLAASAFFAELSLLAQPRSEQAQVALRLFYLTSALAAISLDYMLADQAFQSQDDRRQTIIGSIRFGESEVVTALPTIRAAIGLARKYVENGTAAAKQIEYGFYGDADRIPAEIIADYVARISASGTLFNVAREIERAATSAELLSYDQLSNDAKSLLGVLLDFNSISREKIAMAWPRGAKASGSDAPNDADPLFTESEPRVGPGSPATKGSREA